MGGAPGAGAPRPSDVGGRIPVVGQLAAGRHSDGALEAKVTDGLWSRDDIAALVDAREESAADVTRKGWTKRKAGR